jgi:hypothetical protein
MRNNFAIFELPIGRLPKERQRIGAIAVLRLALTILLASCSPSSPPNLPRAPVPFPPPPEEARYFHEHSIYSTANVENSTDEERWREILTGTSRKSGIRFSKPFDVAVHQGRVFVSDSVMQVVFALDFPEQRTFLIGNRGDDGDLGKPLGIAVDGKGNLYVADNGLKRISMYDRDGNFRGAFGGKGVLDRPTGIEVNQDGSRAFVVDVGGVKSENHRIHVFDPRDGKLLHEISSRGRAPGQLNLPRDVALAPNGLLYVTDGGNFRVQALSPEGEFVREWGKAGMRFGNFSRPKGIATDRDSNVYVVDAAFGNFQIFDPEGQLLLFIGRRSEKDGPAVFMLPAGIAVDEDGRVYVIDQFYRKLEIIRPAGLPAGSGFLAAKPPEKK